MTNCSMGAVLQCGDSPGHSQLIEVEGSSREMLNSWKWLGDKAMFMGLCNKQTYQPLIVCAYTTALSNFHCLTSPWLATKDLSYIVEFFFS